MVGLAALVCAGLLALLVLFQAALAAGAPWGRAAYGGTHTRLPVALRLASALAVVLWIVAIVIVLQAGDRLPGEPLPDELVRVGLWVCVGLFVLAVIANAATPSRLERAIWLPVSLVLLGSSLVVALA